MNYKFTYNLVCKMLLVEAGLMLIPAVVSILYGEWKSCICFAITAAIISLVTLPMFFIEQTNKSLYAKEGIIVVAIAWLTWSLFGALPFVMEGCIPNYIDAFFETVSGFTTTGATILDDIEALPHGMLFWRSFTHFIGGMGVLVFVMAIIPLSDNYSMLLMRAEVPGPTVGKLVPKGKSTAKILYLIYIGLTLVQIVFLLIGGMPLFDSIVNAFATAGTGGFAIYNNSIAHYNSVYLEMVITVFMILFGVNFNLYYYILIGKAKSVLKNTEWKVYFIIIGIATAIITIATIAFYGSFGSALRYAFFQVASFMTSTGFVTTSYAAWPKICQGVLLTLMMIGACAGSTGGGLKIARIMILFKAVKREMHQLIHPKSVSPVKVDDKVVEDKTMNSALVYFFVFLVIMICAVFLLTFNGFDFETNMTSVISCINNIGPGYGAAVSSFSCYSGFSKIVLSFCMLLGRLEIFPMLILFIPSVWKKKFF